MTKPNVSTGPIKSVAALLIVCAVSACETADDFTDSGFENNIVGGQIFKSGVAPVRSGSEIDSSGDGFAYMVGKTSDDGFRGYAGIVPTTRVEAIPPSGTASMTGRYEAARIFGIKLAGNSLTGLAVAGAGDITLQADFNRRKLTGTSDDGNLSVNGEFTGNNLAGTVVYHGANGELAGLVDGDEAIGAFHGNSGTDIIAGGFLVDK